MSLEFEDNDTAHDDIILRFAGQAWVCDSYYLALDRGILPKREDADKVRVVLHALLRQWLSAVESVPDGGTVYLPYDFSDQGTGWLRCHRCGDAVTVHRGWAGTEGWSISPSAVGECLTQLKGFHPEGAAVHMSLPEFIGAIHASMKKTSQSEGSST